MSTEIDSDIQESVLPENINSIAVFEGQIKVDASRRKLLRDDDCEVDASESLQCLDLHVGEERLLSIAVKGDDGTWGIIADSKTLRRLRVKSSDYSVWAQARPSLMVVGREVSANPVVVRFAFKVGSLLNPKNVHTEIRITVKRGYSFVASVDGSLNGVPLAIWQFGREHMSISWRRRPTQYILDASIGMHAKNTLGNVCYGFCDSMAKGWQPLYLKQVSSSDSKALVCELDETQKHFSMNLRRKAGSLAVTAVDGDDSSHEIVVKVLPEAEETKWHGVRESARFRSRARMRWHWWMRCIGSTVCVVFASMWLWGCWQAQVQQRGLGAGTLYTAGTLGIGVGLVVAITAVAFVFNVLMFGLSRKFKK